MAIIQFRCTSRTCLSRFWLEKHFMQVLSMEPLQWHYKCDLYNTDPSLTWPLCSAPCIHIRVIGVFLQPLIVKGVSHGYKVHLSFWMCSEPWPIVIEDVANGIFQKVTTSSTLNSNRLRKASEPPKSCIAA